MTLRGSGRDYRDVLRIRRFEEEILALSRSGEIAGSVHLCIGQEAVAVGACRSLEAKDHIVATYRGHGWALGAGVPMVEMFAELLGRESRLNGGRGGSAHLMAPAFRFLGENSIVGAGLPMALGASLAMQFAGDDALALVAVGDGALNQGVVHETLNMAAVLHVPLLVVVENNGYAEMTPSAALTAIQAHDRATAYGVSGYLIDGNDVGTVERAVAMAREQSMNERKPVILEAMTHRLAGHYSGDTQAYRRPGELEDAKEREPLARLAAELGDEVERIRLAAEVETEVGQALEAARNCAYPDTSSVLEQIYG